MALRVTAKIHFTAVVPNQSRKEKELASAKARSHAATVSHSSRAGDRSKTAGKATVRFDHSGARKGSQRQTRSRQRETPTGEFTSPPTPIDRYHKPTVTSTSAMASSCHDRRIPPARPGLGRPGRPTAVDLNPYPIGKTESVQIAMQYCVCPVDVIQLGTQTEAAKWLQMLFPRLVQDVLWFTATVALCLELRRRGTPGSQSLALGSLEYHRRTTTEVRRRLSAEDDYTGDGVLMAIGTLISMSILQGDMKAANNHVNGLKNLVLLRGGVRSLLSFDGYLRERIVGHFIMWDLTQAALEIDAGPSVYPKHPFPPDLCGHISKLPSGLEELAFSGSLNCAIIRLLAGIALYTSRILSSTRKRPADVRKMLTFVYALSRQARLAKLNPVEQILVVVLVEACVSLGSTRNLHWVMISYQQSRISALLCTTSVRDVSRNLTTYQDAFIWMGAVLLATGNADSDPWRLGKQLVDEGHNSMGWSALIKLCDRYIWYDELSVRLARNMGEK